jgi:hypothetical protein
MSLLSDFFIASPELAPCYPTERPPSSDRAEFNGLTYQELSELWAVLEHVPWKPDHLKAFECVFMVDRGTVLIHRFPAPFVAALATLDETDADAAASEWVKIGELAYLSCPPTEARRILDAASRLAVRAQESGKSLYLYMCC